MLVDELAKLELKWKEQVKINESLKLQLAAEEDRYKVSAPYCSSAYPVRVCSETNFSSRGGIPCCLFLGRTRFNEHFLEIQSGWA